MKYEPGENRYSIALSQTTPYALKAIVFGALLVSQALILSDLGLVQEMEGLLRIAGWAAFAYGLYPLWSAGLCHVEELLVSRFKDRIPVKEERQQ